MTNDNRGIHDRIARTSDDSLHDEPGYDEGDVPTMSDAHALELQRARKIIYFLTNAAAIVILLRFLLLSLGANTENNFFSILVLRVSDPLVIPFKGLFGPPLQLGAAGNMQIDFSYIVAIGMYYLLAMGVVKLISLYYTRYS
jgi:uncharacterized protein YggT (Ycf19 family)